MLHSVILADSVSFLTDPSPRWLGAVVTTPLATAAWGAYHSEGNVQECAWLWL